MSALSLISKMGKAAGLIRPTNNVTAYGAVERDYSGGASDIVAFLQPRSANITDRAGGDRMGVTFRAYIAGIEDVRADDIIIYPASGSDASRYRVTGVIVPDHIGDATYPNMHTIVDCERVSPTMDIPV